MINIKGVNYANPGVFSEAQTVSTGVSIPANNRVLCIVGEGRRREVLINFAAGSGQDGVNSTYTSATGADGRHFQLSNYPIISNRTTLTKNGVTLTGLQQAVSATTGGFTGTLSSLYDYRIDINTGKIELQGANLVDQGGAYYTASGTIVGNGTINNLTLIDDSAPNENWTVRCTSVRKDGYGQPIDGYARFTVSGSVSGIILDGYGAPIVWQSDGVLRNNGILRFSISEGSTAFNVGDTFVIEVESGVLEAGDQLIAQYIATLDINDPEFFTDMESITAKHGLASTDNTLSLGAQLAFANGTPGILCCQAAPSIPRRETYRVVDTATGGVTEEDLSFPLPTGVVPDSDTSVTFFVVNTITNTSEQIFPNKVDFYNASYEASPLTFINGAAPYSYTVVMEDGVKREGSDLVITPGAGNTAVVSSATVSFDLSDVTATTSFTIWGASNPNNNGDFTIIGVSDGKLSISGTAPFSSETGLDFRLIDSSEETAYVLLTKDLALTSSQGLSVGVIDTKDASFFDAGWTNAMLKLESWELDILVPLPSQTISAIFNTSLQHCLKMSRIKNRKERVLFIGAIDGLTVDNVIGNTLAAVEDLGVLEGIQGDEATEILAGNIEDLANYSVTDAFGSTYRCVYFYPDRIVVSIQGTNTFVDGFYLAAAAGGYLSGVGNVAIPLTNKTLGGFTILNDRTYNSTEAENITKAGITLIEPVLGGGRCVWGKTSSASNFPEEEELSIVFIRDKISKNTRLACSGFIGVAETPTFGTSLQTRIISTLNGFVTQGLITQYADVKVKRDTVDPRQFNVSFAVTPAYPVNWIYIKFEIGTT
jgi:hypothetical protein